MKKAAYVLIAVLAIGASFAAQSRPTNNPSVTCCEPPPQCPPTGCPPAK